MRLELRRRGTPVRRYRGEATVDAVGEALRCSQGRFSIKKRLSAEAGASRSRPS